MGVDHIVKSYDEDLRFLNRRIQDMSELTVHHLRQALKSIMDRDITLAQQVVEHDPNVDNIENEIDTFAVRMIALRQPVAKDLRHVITALKISSHLERIADYAANIARRAIKLAQTTPIHSIHMIIRMESLVEDMIKDAILAYVEANDRKAKEVWLRDNEVDEIYLSYLRELLTYMMEDPRNISPCTELLFVAKNLERIGDHTTNIAEMVYYYTHGTPLKVKRSS